MIWLQLIFLGLFMLLAISAVLQIIFARKFAPWVPSQMKLLDRVLSDLSLEPADRFIDLGCGDGRAVILAAKKYNLTAIGVENAPLMWLIAKLCRFFSGAKQAKIIYGDLYKMDLRPYKIIYIFALPDTIKKNLTPKLKSKLRPGTFLISYDFSLPGLTPEKAISDKWRKIMVYRF